MDKYEFNIKVEQIRKLVNKGDYETAMKIADTIDWKKVHNTSLLSMVAQVYEKNEEYQDAKDLLLLAFERAPIGKRLLYKLTELALKEGNVDEAEAYYREFCDLASDDPRQYLLRYMILKDKGATVEQLIHSLESYTAEELDEKWLYELAELYHTAGNEAMCVSTCDKIMLMFGLGKYVDKAMELKIQYAPLTKYQMDLVENREKYEAKLRAVEQSSGKEYFAEEKQPAAPSKAAAPAGQNAPMAAAAPADLDVSLAVAAPEDLKTPVIANAPEPVMELDSMDEALAAAGPVVPVDVVADVKQAEAEARLAAEMSRLTIEDYREDDDDKGKTRVLKDIKRVPGVSQETTILPDINRAAEGAELKGTMTAVREDETGPEQSRFTNHLIIEARTPEKGMELALETLRKLQKETGIKNSVAKITGSKLSKKGIRASLDKLSGKDLLIDEAGDLSPATLKELEDLITQDSSGMRIILIDNPKQMEMLHAQNPSLASKFECIGNDDSQCEESTGKATGSPVSAPEVDNRPVRHVVPVRDSEMRASKPVVRPENFAADDEVEMDIDEFAQYACKYATEIDCSITGKSMLALYERIEIMEEDGILLNKSNAEALIEEAADRAEKPTFGKRITGIFSSKYDKDGLLILKEEHFI